LVGQPREVADNSPSLERKVSKLPELCDERGERMTSFVAFQLVDNARARSTISFNGVESEAKIPESGGFR
jgi:hypothetical protein